MKTYLIKISWYQPYPKEAEYRVQASSIATSTARALRDWKAEVGRKRCDNLTVKIIPLGI